METEVDRAGNVVFEELAVFTYLTYFFHSLWELSGDSVTMEPPVHTLAIFLVHRLSITYLK